MGASVGVYGISQKQGKSFIKIYIGLYLSSREATAEEKAPGKFVWEA